MRKHLIIISAIILPTSPTLAAMTISRCTEIVCSGAASEETLISTNSSYTSTCYENTSGQTVKINSATSCPSGYELTSQTFTSLNCPDNLFSYNACVATCADCEDCTSDTTWSVTVILGYQIKVSRTCDCGACVETPSYRCAAGYYGSSTNGTSGCTRCPQATGVYSDSGLTTLIRGTSAAGSTAQTSCYIPSGTTFYDAMGSGTYDGNSYYCE